jgi:GAF domain-containing protein
LFPFESAQLMLKEGLVIKNVATDKNHPDLMGRTFSVKDSISGLSLQERRTIYIADLDIAPKELKNLYKEPGEGLRFRSELVVPLVIGDEGIGAYNIESSEVNAFDVRERNMLEILSGHVALAIELARAQEEAASLSAVARDLSIKTEPYEVITLILDHALRMIKGSFGQILILENDGLIIRQATSNFLQSLGRKHTIDGSVGGLAVLESSPVIVPDVNRTEYRVIRFEDIGDGADRVIETVSKYMTRALYQNPIGTQKDDALRMRSELVVPIMIDGRVIGVLNVESPENEFFTQDHARILRAFARQVAGALGRTQLQQQKDAERKVAFQSEFAQRFAAGFTHQVRSPSSGILTDIRFMRSELSILFSNNPSLDEYLTGIEQEARKINQLPNEIAKRAREFTRSHTTSREWIGSVFKLLNTSDSRISHLDKILGMTSYEDSINDPAVFEIDASSHLVIENLLINATEAIEHAGITDGHIVIGTHRTSDGHLEVCVEDNGPGVPDAIKHIIFERDFSSRPVSGGVGLWWVKNHLESYGAKIWVEDASSGVGARFVIRFRILSGGN